MDTFANVITLVIALAIIIAAAWTGAWAARRFAGPSHGAREKTASANAAAAGFLLGAGLFHFLPEANAHFELLYPLHAFPIGFVLAAVGFTTILGIERMLFDPEAHALEDTGRTTAVPVLAIALSLHALFAGFAVGSERVGVALLSLSAALAVHKFAAAFTLGSGLIRGRVSGTTFRNVILAFSLATPIGMILGSGFQRVLEDETGLLVEATFDALAAGTFLYIAALEVIHEEFFHKRAQWLNMVLFVGGLGVMVLLSLAE